jgi:hypothetical protein
MSVKEEEEGGEKQDREERIYNILIQKGIL